MSTIRRYGLEHGSASVALKEHPLSSRGIAKSDECEEECVEREKNNSRSMGAK
jgi:hypothetical protein